MDQARKVFVIHTVARKGKDKTRLLEVFFNAMAQQIDLVLFLQAPFMY